MKIILSSLILAVAVVSTGIGGVPVVGAETHETDRVSIAQRFAERFDLDEAEVQKFFDEIRDERRDRRLDRWETVLQMAVEDGVITAEQARALIAKKAELHEKKKALHDLPRDERRDAIKRFRAEFQEWAEANDIDLKKLKRYFVHYHGTKNSTDR